MRNGLQWHALIGAEKEGNAVGTVVSKRLVGKVNLELHVGNAQGRQTFGHIRFDGFGCFHARLCEHGGQGLTFAFQLLEACGQFGQLLVGILDDVELLA